MKFKMSKLAVAMVAAGAVGSASAVSVNPDGTGQVLIFPYYNVNNGFVTNVEIINTKDEYKIVKVRLREGGNSQDVLDFNIYLSPYDVWKGVIRPVERTENGEKVTRANIVSADTTCTLPMNNKALTINGVGGLKLNSTGWDMNVIYPDVTDADAREGYIEVIEMGVIDKDTYIDLDGDGATDDVSDGGAVQITNAVKHVDGVPPNCEAIEAAWNNGTTIGSQPSGAQVPNWGTYSPNGYVYVGDADPEAALMAPTGGLYGFEVLLNTQQGAAFIADATGIDHYSTVSQHYRSDDPMHFLQPSLASGDVSSVMIPVPDQDGAVIMSGIDTTVDATLNDGDDNTPWSGNNPLPMAMVLQATSVANSYFVNPDFDGATEWVLTFPMKKHGIFNGQYSNGALLFDSATGDYSCSDKDQDGNAVGAPVTSSTPGTEGTNVCFAGRDKDAVISVTVYDREEGTITPESPGFTVSPVINPESPQIILKREVNVVSFSETGSSILGATEVTNLSPGPEFKAGWANIKFDGKYCLTNAQLTSSSNPPDVNFLSTDYAGFCGIPVVGFGAMQGRDFSVQEGAYFGETTEHRFMRNLTPTATP